MLVERPEGAATRASFRALTGSDDEYAAWRGFYEAVGSVAAAVAPTLTLPLPRRSRLAEQADPAVWRDLVERPLGEAIRRRFRDDTVRGVVATDALIGTFARLDDPTLVQNRCFLYHLIGNGTGEWRVPVGGMGAVTDALAARARESGADLVTGTEVTAIRGGADGAEVDVAESAAGARSVRARYVLANVAPWTLAGLLGLERDRAAKPAGAQLKVNFLLSRLPRLKSGASPQVAFAGTLHLSEDYGDLERAYAQAAAGEVPGRLPGEVYCHSLTDPSILGPVPAGTHTLTYFGLHLPAALFADPATRASRKALAVERAIASLDEHLVDPVESVVARDPGGRPCIEAKVPQDIEADLGMPGGHIFHGDLSWPWADDTDALDTPAARWGVDTGVPRVLLCGSGAVRGGAVSGLGGHNAAQAVLELI
jgi:phytoene dehydrogenase-like protein